MLEVFWFGRIASAIHLRISLQMAYGLREDFVGAGLRIPFAWSRRCGQPTDFTSRSTSPPRLITSSIRFDTWRPAADPLAAPKVVAFDTLVSFGTGTTKKRRREIRGRSSVSTTINTWCPDTVGIVGVKWLIVSSSSISHNFDSVSRSLGRTQREAAREADRVIVRPRGGESDLAAAADGVCRLPRDL